jgi:Zn-dependent protease
MGGMDLSDILIVILIIFVSMTLHEIMHGLVAHWLGDDTAKMMGRLTLNPLKHVDPVLTIGLPLLIIVTNALTGTNTPIFGGAKPVPFNPARIDHDEWGVAAVAIAGPLVNLLLALVAYGILTFVGAGMPELLQRILTSAVWVNLGFFAFNLLPIPPLDGSRALYALAPDFVRKFMDSMERYGLVVVFVIVMFAGSLLGGYMSAMINGVLWLFERLFGVA